MGAWAVPVAGAAFGLWRVLKAQGDNFTRALQAQSEGFTREIKAQGDNFTRALQVQSEGFTREIKAQSDNFTRALQAQGEGFARELQAHSENLNKRLDVICEDMREIRSELHVLGERVARIEGAIGVRPAVPGATGSGDARTEPLAAAGV